MKRKLISLLLIGTIMSMDFLTSISGQHVVMAEEIDEDNFHATEIHYAELFVEKYSDDINQQLQVDSIVSTNDHRKVNFEYDSEGNRISEYTDEMEITFEYDNNNRLVKSKKDNEILIEFEYNSDEFINDCTSIQYNNTDYILVYDKQRNVSGIKDVSGKLVARYSYDSNGNCNVLGKNQKGKWIDMSKNKDFIGNINPIRMNGNYYDNVSGYYMVNGLCYDQENNKYMKDSFKLEEQGEKAFLCTVSSSTIDTIANNFLQSSTYGKQISYSSTWYSSLSTIELIARIIYGECVLTGDMPAVTWELVNRKAANWSSFYGSGKSNTLWNIATKAYAYSTITGSSADTDNARNPVITSTKWKQATWYSCALFYAQTRSELSDLVYQPTGINKQCYHVGTCLYKSFSGTSASTLSYNGNKIKSVVVVNVNSSITSSTTIKSIYSTYSGKYNVFFTISSEYGTYYSIS